MAKRVVIPITLSVVMMLFFPHVNAETVIVQSSSASGSDSCIGTSCSSGHSCSETFRAIGDNNTKVKFCTDLSGNYHREQITTTLVGDLECIINTTDVNGKVTTTKNCSVITPQELEQRQEEWEKQMNTLREGEEKLNSLLESQERAWAKQQKEMSEAFERHEKFLEQAMQERDKQLEMHQKHMDRQFERLANLDE